MQKIDLREEEKEHKVKEEVAEETARRETVEVSEADASEIQDN